MKLKIMTFNTQHCLNFITRKIDFDVMANAIKEVDPDIVGLQEMRGAGFLPDYRDQVGILSYRLGMNGAFGEAIKFGGVNPYGVGILSRFPIKSSETFGIPDPNPKKFNGAYETRTLFRNVVELPGEKTLDVFVSHFGLNPDEHENAVETVIKHIPESRAVFMGDLNMTPDNPILSPIFEKLNDTAGAAKKGADLRTFTSNAPSRKIDYIFTTKDIKTLNSCVPEIIASDHRPFVCEIEV